MTYNFYKDNFYKKKIQGNVKRKIKGVNSMAANEYQAQGSELGFLLQAPETKQHTFCIEYLLFLMFTITIFIGMYIRCV